MSNYSYFNTLPVEILYRIFDNLDVQTILLSIRYVCKHLYLTTNTYDRYRFHFQSISKPNFQFICQLIPYENILSLILSDEDQTRGQISYFLSLCHIEQFHRLQSLTLREIDDTCLNIFFNYILKSSLESLSISMQTFQMHQTIISSTFLSAAIAHHTLRNLYLNIGLQNWNDIQWPTSCTLRYLRLVNSITLKYFCRILDHSPCLKTLVLKEISRDDSDEDIYSTPFKQLTSLTFEDGRIEINRIDQCLSLTPSLINLKLIGDGTLFESTFDGFQWEKIIQTKLHSLRKFEFFFRILTYSNYRSRNVDMLINSFRTSFWLQKLHCFITCDYMANSRKIMLYTSPICHTHFIYHIDLKKISLSNFLPQINQNDMDYVQNLDINITKEMKIPSIEQTESSDHFLFRNVNSLKLGNDGEWPKNALRFLSTILDLSHIVQLSLSVNFLPEHMLNTASNIKFLLNQASNLHSLLLYDYWTPENCMQRMKTICSILTSNIKHLQIRVKDLNDIKYILERLEHLTSVTFEYAQMLTINRQEFLQSLAYLNRYSSIWDSEHVLHVWLGKKKE